jgi:hypothetical protein
VTPTLEIPQKVTIVWLIQHLSIAGWVTAFGLLCSVFWSGMYAATHWGPVVDAFRQEQPQHARSLPSPTDDSKARKAEGLVSLPLTPAAKATNAANAEATEHPVQN